MPVHLALILHLAQNVPAEAKKYGIHLENHRARVALVPQDPAAAAMKMIVPRGDVVSEMTGQRVQLMVALMLIRAARVPVIPGLLVIGMMLRHVRALIEQILVPHEVAMKHQLGLRVRAMIARLVVLTIAHRVLA